MEERPPHTHTPLKMFLPGGFQQEDQAGDHAPGTQLGLRHISLCGSLPLECC